VVRLGNFKKLTFSQEFALQNQVISPLRSQKITITKAHCYWEITIPKFFVQGDVSDNRKLKRHQEAPLIITLPRDMKLPVILNRIFFYLRLFRHSQLYYKMVHQKSLEAVR